MNAVKRNRSRVGARAGRWVSVGVVVVVLLAACTSTDGSSGLEDPGDCVPVDMVVSSEKLALLTDLAHEFNDSPQAELDGGECGFGGSQPTQIDRAQDLRVAMISRGTANQGEGRKTCLTNP